MCFIKLYKLLDYILQDYIFHILYYTRLNFNIYISQIHSIMLQDYIL